MNVISSIYDETVVVQPRVRYIPAAIERILSDHGNVLSHKVGDDYSITFVMDTTNIRRAAQALKNARFEKPVRIRTDGKTTITVEPITML